MSDDVKRKVEALIDKTNADMRALLAAAKGWAEMWDSFRESGLEPVLTPEEEKLDAAVAALREARK